MDQGTPEYTNFISAVKFQAHPVLRTQFYFYSALPQPIKIDEPPRASRNVTIQFRVDTQAAGSAQSSLTFVIREVRK